MALTRDEMTTIATEMLQMMQQQSLLPAHPQYNYSVITDEGLALIQKAYNAGTRVNITHYALGDGNGVDVIPSPVATRLVNEFGREAITLADTSQNHIIRAELYVPSKYQGHTIREFGLYDEHGHLIVYGNYAPTTIGAQASPSFVQIKVAVTVVLENASAVTVTVNPDSAIYKIISKDDGHEIKGSQVTIEALDVGALPLHGKSDDSSLLNGEDKTQIIHGLATVVALNQAKTAATHYTDQQIAALIANAPGALNTLKEIADKLAQEDSAIAAIRTLITDTMVPVGVPFPWPTNVAPTGFAIMKGQVFDPVRYPKLALVYPKTTHVDWSEDGHAGTVSSAHRIPDMRRLAIVGASGVGLPGMEVLKFEGDGVISHTHSASSSSAGEHHHTIPTGSQPGEVGHTNAGSSGQGGWRDVSTSTEGGHLHSVVISPFGQTENTIKNRKFNWIVRMA